MKYQKFLYFLQNVGKDPSALIFEDELTGLNNRRYLLHYFQTGIDWKALDLHPVCLLMINIDYFKRINEQYGHNTGDQVLVHAARMLRSHAPKDALCVRYAGDNFLLVLPGRKKEDARPIAAKLVREIREQAFFVPETGTRIPLTASAGLAAAPDDAADSKALIHMADTAMYHAKQSGRDRCADAATALQKPVFPRAALQYLERAGIAGRKEALEKVGEALARFSGGANQFVLVEGAPGMGKTRFLSAVQENLDPGLDPIRVHGVVQEAFRPYYMVAYIALALMNRLEDKGLSVLENTDSAEIERISHVIPQIRDGPAPLPENDRAKREAIFLSFTRFLARLADARPLVLLIDDLHYCDPASLHLMRMLMESHQLKVFICGTVSVEKQAVGETVALDLFRNAYSEKLSIREIPLPPLSEKDIEAHLRLGFDGIRPPPELCAEMARVTRGNPLFLNEIIRKMITDGKVLRQEGKWTIRPLEKDYFPKSLEEIIRQKMETLDEESRKFLDRASAFGESTFLSMLAGIARERSDRLYDIINHAEEQGIVRAEFEENDENIRFLSKQIRDIIYEGISPEEKKLLHQQIGAYQEKLFRQNLLPSASFLAHHFHRSEDLEKAKSYSDFQETHNRLIFDEQEIGGYAVKAPDTEAAGRRPKPGTGGGAGEVPLSRQSMDLVPHLLRALLVAVRNTRLYPAGSKSVTGAARDLLKLLERIFNTDTRLSITAEEQKIWINGEQIREGAFSPLAGKVYELWDQLEIKSLVFEPGVSETELQALLDELSRGGRKTVTPGFWESFARARNLSHIIPRQVTYTKIEPPADHEEPAVSGDEQADAEPIPQAGEEENGIREEQLGRIERVIASLLGAYSKLRLYPADGPVARKAVSQLFSRLKAYLADYRMLTIARVNGALLINGVKVDPAGFEALFTGMADLLSAAGIHSITFSDNLSENDLQAFFRALFQAPPEKLGGDFWRNFGRERKLSGLFFDRRIYGVHQMRPRAGDAPEPEKPGKPRPADKTAVAFDLEKQDLARRLQDLFLRGQTERMAGILSQIVQKYEASDPAGKKQIAGALHAASEPADWQPPAAYCKMFLKPTAAVLEKETDAERVRKIADILHACAARLIRFEQYPAAAWTFSRLRQHPKITETAALETWNRPHAFGKYLDAAVVDALWADLKSENRSRRQEAWLLVSTMGRGMIPLLIDMIREEDDIRIRRMAAEQLGRLGPAGAEQLRQSLMSESRGEEKSRMLDVIDSVTTNLVTELRYTLADPRETVRRAALRLAQRLDKPKITALLAEVACSADPELAIQAVNAIGSQKTGQAAAALVAVLDRARDPGVLSAACLAMGQIGDKAFAGPLARILFPPRRWLRRRHHPSQVRVAAAYALCRVPGREADQMLRALRNDPDPRVREAAAGKE